jgi:hypothetical protein
MNAGEHNTDRELAGGKQRRLVSRRMHCEVCAKVGEYYPTNQNDSLLGVDNYCRKWCSRARFAIVGVLCHAFKKT